MKKIAFVIPWYSEKITGGAELATKGLVENLVQRGFEAEVLTTCVKSFSSDWNDNFFSQGEEIINGVKVRRFLVRKRLTDRFDTINQKLMNNQEISYDEEQIFLNEMVNSPQLYDYISENLDSYSAFVFTPYMFGTTYFGVKRAGKKAVLIPCFHDEKYAYMKHYRETFSEIAGIIFLSEPENLFAHRVYDFSKTKTAVLGTGLNVDITCDSDRFKKEYRIDSPFILYAGRKDSGKNIETLLGYFEKYKSRNASRLKLVLIGGGKIATKYENNKDIIDLGFLPVQDKLDAYQAAELLCQPSANESFSLVIMESWLCGTPVLVNENCAVTKDFVVRTNGGLYFKDYFDFEGCVDYLIASHEVALKMGENGKAFVCANYSWNSTVEKYISFIREATCK